MTELIKDSVMGRDKQCLFTGSTEEGTLDVSWILPPVVIQGPVPLLTYIRHSRSD